MSFLTTQPIGIATIYSQILYSLSTYPLPARTSAPVVEKERCAAWEEADWAARRLTLAATKEAIVEQLDYYNTISKAQQNRVCRHSIERRCDAPLSLVLMLPTSVSSCARIVLALLIAVEIRTFGTFNWQRTNQMCRIPLSVLFSWVRASWYGLYSAIIPFSSLPT